MKRKYKRAKTNLIKYFLKTIKWAAILLVSFFFIIYLISHPLKSNSKEKNLDESEELEKEEFILQFSSDAQEISNNHGVRTSVLVAQAALESNWGNSQLAKESKNYFGIKSKNGKEYKTKEFKENEWIEIKTNFKEYESTYDSILDYVDLLENGTSWNSNLYQGVFEAKNYEEAAFALSQAGYATDPDYAEKIIEIIEQYELNELDDL